jgi:hypothetical protein
VPVKEVCRDAPELIPAVAAAVAAADRLNDFFSSAETPLAGHRPDAPNDDTVEVPDRLPATIGEYQVVRRLGRGGMGEVYSAEDPRLGRRVAVKVMRADIAAKPGFRERFLREARAAAAVEHDHVVPVWHVGEDGVVPYMVMPLLAGETLQERLKVGPLPPEEVSRIGREAALGLAAAHEKGMVHRDVKPANLWLEAPGGRVKVLDFGLARAADSADVLTRSGDVLGTPAYMAPEQADGLDVDARADLFALGATLYEMATGTAAFRRPTLTATLRAVVDHTPRPPHEVNPAVPAALSDLVMRLLAKKPEDRPTATATADELAQLARGDGTVAIASTKSSRRRLVPLILGAVALIALVVVLLLVQCPGNPPRELGVPGDQKEMPGQSSAEPPTVPPRVAALTVDKFEVRPHKDLGGGQYKRLLLFGYEGNPAAAADEAIGVNVTLSRPAYCYLIVFRADGVDQVLYPQDDTDTPEKTDRPCYPSKRRDSLYGLDDGPGLWAVAVVTSDEPLPSYKEWRKQHAGGPWKPQPTPPAAVMLDDGRELETFSPGQTSTRGNRGEKTVADRTPVVTLVDWLKAQTGSAAAALAFPVRAAK